jgi:hypothetical protein
MATSEILTSPQSVAKDGSDASIAKGQSSDGRLSRENQSGDVSALKNTGAAQSVVDKHFPSADSLLGNATQQTSNTSFADGGRQTMTTSAHPDGSVDYNARTALPNGGLNTYEGRLSSDGTYQSSNHTVNKDLSQSMLKTDNSGSSRLDTQSPDGKQIQAREFGADGKENLNQESTIVGTGRVDRSTTADGTTIKTFDGINGSSTFKQVSETKIGADGKLVTGAQSTQ